MQLHVKRCYLLIYTTRIGVNCSELAWPHFSMFQAGDVNCENLTLLIIQYSACLYCSGSVASKYLHIVSSFSAILPLQQQNTNFAINIKWQHLASVLEM